MFQLENNVLEYQGMLPIFQSLQPLYSILATEWLLYIKTNDKANLKNELDAIITALNQMHDWISAAKDSIVANLKQKIADQRACRNTPSIKQSLTDWENDFMKTYYVGLETNRDSILQIGGRRGAYTFPCNWGCYLVRYPDLLDAYGNDWEKAKSHYELIGKNEGRYCSCDPNDSCNWICYLNRYEDLQISYGWNQDLAAQHYINFGRPVENRDCKCKSNDNCNWSCYLDRYNDLQISYGESEALAAGHYFLHGKYEGRNCHC